MPITCTQPEKEEIKDEKPSSFSKTENKTKQKYLFKSFKNALVLMSLFSILSRLLDLHSPLIPSSFATTYRDYWLNFVCFNYDYFIRLLDLGIESGFLLCVLYLSILNISLPEKAGNDALIPSTSNPDNSFDKYRTLITFYLILSWLTRISKSLPVLLYPFIASLFPDSEIDPSKVKYNFWRWLPDVFLSFFSLICVLYLSIYYLRNHYGLRNRAGVESV